MSDLPQAICYTQPHGDLKEIRLTSWTMAVVLGKRYGFKYVWSTDSDTRVLPDTISTMAHTLAAEPNAGGASVHVRLHNEKETNIAQMTGLTFALDTYLNRAAAGALNKSEYLHGPATILRLSALEEVIVPWCRFHYFFSDRSQNTVSCSTLVIGSCSQPTRLSTKISSIRCFWQRRDGKDCTLKPPQF